MKLVHKRLLLVLGSTLFAFGLAGLFLVCLAWECGFFPDWGMEFGYYGQYNRVKHVIESMPDVKIVDHWQHRDLSLEDFGFTLRVEGTRKVQLDFHDDSYEMKERNRQRLRDFIQRRIGATQERLSRPK